MDFMFQLIFLVSVKIMIFLGRLPARVDILATTSNLQVNVVVVVVFSVFNGLIKVICKQ